MQCQFFKNDGSRCLAAALKDGGFCFVHEPQNQEAHHEASVKGGSMPKKNGLDLPPLSIQNAQEIVVLLEDIINGVRAGEIPVNIGNCVGYLANVTLKALEVSDLEKRVEAIETLIGERNLPTVKYD